VFAIFIGVTMAIRALGETVYLLEPAWAAWIPILIFLPYAFAKSRWAMKT